MAHTSAYLDRLAELPAFRGCSRSQLVLASGLVDEVVLPPGAMLPGSTREVVIALAPTRVLVVERRALPALLELVPRLFDPPVPEGTPAAAPRLIGACSLSSA